MKSTSVLLNSDTEVEWSKVKEDVELLYTTWNTIILDLYKLEVPIDDVSNFSTNLNELVINVKNEKKIETLECLANLYSILSTYIQYASNNSYDVNMQNTKQHLVLAYANIENENWYEVANEVNLAIDSYAPIITYLGHNSKQNDFMINKIYVMLNELKNAIVSEDKDLFYINYKMLMNEL